ncbi:hypothetical protein JCM19232_2652 [Vibrio ishigakensis]|uniref:Uncharacterized protein n=1 Tax=Vibrio ishigakensis TaxID=1481914 RepID=A0A0B8PGC1_9VIBR|nr:hypothetical protein JCM19232_2652 [Vibrio ishigakensis]
MADIIQTAPEEKIIVEDPADENIIIEFSREEHDPFLDRAEVAALKAEFYAGDAERSAIASKAQADQSEESAVASDESQKAAAEHEEASSVSAQAAADSEQASALHEQGSAENAAESELQADRSEEHADRAESIANGLEDVIRNPGTFDPNSGYPTGFDPLIPQLWFANNDGDIDDVQWSIGQALLWEPNSASFYRVAGELVSGQGGGTFELSGSLIVPVNYGLFARGDLGNVHHLISLDEDRDVVIGKSALATQMVTVWRVFQLVESQFWCHLKQRAT